MAAPYYLLSPNVVYRWSLWAKGNSGAWYDVIPRNSPLTKSNFCSNMKYIWDHGGALPDGTQLSGKTPLYAEMKAQNLHVLGAWMGEYMILRQQIGC